MQIVMQTIIHVCIYLAYLLLPLILICIRIKFINIWILDTKQVEEEPRMNWNVPRFKINEDAAQITILENWFLQKYWNLKQKDYLV